MSSSRFSCGAGKRYLWGAGSSAIEFLDAYPELQIDAVIETTPKTTSFRGYPVVASSEADFSKADIIIGSEFVEDITDAAIKYGASPSRIVPFYELMIQDADACVISYQKCGRTWLRMILGHIFHQHFNIPEQEILRITQSAMRFKKEKPEMPVLVFFHDDGAHRKTANELCEDKKSYLDRSVIFLCRDPRDVIVSNYYHMTYRAKSNNLPMPQFVRNFFPGIIKFYNIWADQLFPHFLLVRYEDLRVNTHKQINRILDYLGLLGNIDDNLIEQAISYCDIKEMAKYEAENKFNSAVLSNPGDTMAAKVRNGKVSGYKAEFDLELQNWCLAELRSLNPLFGYNPDFS